MEIIKIDKNKPDKRNIKRAVGILRRGGVVVYSTDTAYALGCDSTSRQAMARIFKIKKRPREKQLPLIAGSTAMVKKFYKIDKISARLIKKYWPGPLTLVLSIKHNVSTILGRNKKVAVRVPDCKIARLLSGRLGRPIVSTSANLSGQQVCYSASCVIGQFKNQKYQPDLILDAGRLPKRKPSTIVIIKDGRVVILRKGAVEVKS